MPSSRLEPSHRAKKPRIAALDLCRSLAMLAALATHCGVQVQAKLTFEFSWIGLWFRTATPTFIILFGVMIAVNYAAKAARHGLFAVFRIALSRAVQCYLLYVLNVAALMVSGAFGWRYGLLSIAFLGSTPYAEILRFYVILFLLLPGIVWLILRGWVAAATVVAVLFHLGYPLLSHIPRPPLVAGQPVIERLTDFFFGIGGEMAGPSVLHSLVLVFAGVWLGLALRRTDPATRVQGARPLIAIVAVYGTFGLASLFMPGPVTWNGFTGMELRNLNHPAYVFGTGGLALSFIVAMLVLIGSRRLPNWLLLLSRRSLFGFGWGNALIALWPFQAATPAGRWASAMMLLSVVLLFIAGYDRLMRHGEARHKQGLSADLSVVLYKTATGIVRRIDAAIDRVTRRPAAPSQTLQRQAV